MAAGGMDAVTTLVLLTDCARHPTGVLLRVVGAEQVADASRGDMVVATTRRSAAERGMLFLGQRGEAVTYTD